jgi:hypothetical protein
MTLLKSPTDMVWLIGRTQTNGSADYATVHQLQERLQLKKFKVANAALTQVNTPQPPSDWQHSNLPSVPPVIQMRNMRTSDFFQRMMDLMVSNPASADDAPILKRMAQAHLVPGQPVNLNGLDHACFALGRWLADIKVHKVLNTKSADGAWSTPPLNLGAYGTDYNTRAAVAMVGLGANLPQDALYPNTALDQQGQPLKGQHRYRLHFKATQLPPVNAFWSITAYGHDEFLIANPLNRYALGDRDRLHFNADGSLDIWIQAHEPAQAHQRTNWLPVKDKSAFLLNARLYWPKEDALQGTWKMPALERLD